MHAKPRIVMQVRTRVRHRRSSRITALTARSVDTNEHTAERDVLNEEWDGCQREGYGP